MAPEAPLPLSAPGRVWTSPSQLCCKCCRCRHCCPCCCFWNRCRCTRTHYVPSHTHSKSVLERALSPLSILFLKLWPRPESGRVYYSGEREVCVCVCTRVYIIPPLHHCTFFLAAAVNLQPHTQCTTSTHRQGVSGKPNDKL